jgi:hypothetical protein
MFTFRTALVSALAIVFVGAGVSAQHKATDVPVTFTASADFTGPLGSMATTLQIHINQYTSDRDRTDLLAALTKNGYQAFLPAFRKVPIVGYVQIKDQKFDLRWAHHEEQGGGQVVTVATDKPIYFAGGGSPDAKPRAGYELAVIRMEVDGVGMGKGTMAAAARVKPTANAQGVQVDAYADKPIDLKTVTRIF